MTDERYVIIILQVYIRFEN